MLYFGDDAEVAELADAQDLGSCGRKAVEVRLLSSAPPVLLAFFKIRGVEGLEPRASM